MSFVGLDSLGAAPPRGGGGTLPPSHAAPPPSPPKYQGQGVSKGSSGSAGGSEPPRGKGPGARKPNPGASGGEGNQHTYVAPSGAGKTPSKSQQPPAANTPPTGPYPVPPGYTYNATTGQYTNAQTGATFNPQTGQYTPPSGYGLDPTTGMYYSPSTGLYFNTQTGQLQYGPPPGQSGYGGGYGGGGGDSGGGGGGGFDSGLPSGGGDDGGGGGFDYGDSGSPAGDAESALDDAQAQEQDNSAAFSDPSSPLFDPSSAAFDPSSASDGDDGSLLGTVGLDLLGAEIGFDIARLTAMLNQVRVATVERLAYMVDKAIAIQQLAIEAANAAQLPEPQTRQDLLTRLQAHKLVLTLEPKQQGNVVDPALATVKSDIIQAATTLNSVETGAQYKFDTAIQLFSDLVDSAVALVEKAGGAIDKTTSWIPWAIGAVIVVGGVVLLAPYVVPIVVAKIQARR